MTIIYSSLDTTYPKLWIKAPEEHVNDDPSKGLYKETQFVVYSGDVADQTKRLEVGYFFFSPLPGCCGVVVSHATHLGTHFRGSYGKAFHKLKENVARHYGYTVMLATTELRNIPEIVGGANAGWKWGNFFRNKRTTHDLAIGLKELT